MSYTTPMKRGIMKIMIRNARRAQRHDPVFARDKNGNYTGVSAWRPDVTGYVAVQGPLHSFFRGSK